MAAGAGLARAALRVHAPAAASCSYEGGGCKIISKKVRRGGNQLFAHPHAHRAYLSANLFAGDALREGKEPPGSRRNV